MPAPPDANLAEINREIARLEAEVARLGIERSARSKASRRASRRVRYLRTARWFRSPRASFELWPLAVFIAGPIVTGMMAVVIINLVFDSGAMTLIGFLLGALAGASAFAFLLYRPGDSELAAEIPEAESNSKVQRTRLEDTLGELVGVSDQLQERLAARRELATAEKLQRAMLLQREWKAMRGGEWEDFVVEVCRTLGANVERGPVLEEIGRFANSPSAGPRGVIRRPPTTLFVTFSPRRVAAAAVSEINPFHTAAVQQSVHALSQQGCNQLAIITNGRVTTGSRELATSRNCTLIGEDEFPDFVLGKLTI